VDVLSKQVVSVSSYLLRFSLCRWSPHYTCNNLKLSELAKWW
jgi:hypothetical protein